MHPNLLGLCLRSALDTRDVETEADIFYGGNMKRKYIPCQQKHRDEAIKILGVKCQKCGSKVKVELHHIDLNPQNNRPSNWKRLCRKCHMEMHIRLRVDIFPELKRIIDRVVRDFIRDMSVDKL